MSFNKGDKVRIKKQYQFAGSDFNNKVFVVDAAIVVEGRIKTLMVHLDRNPYNFEAHRMEIVPERIEGKEIDVEEIREGDKIRATQVNGELLAIHEGVVDSIYEAAGGRIVLRASDYNRIDFPNTVKTSYVLVKAAPKPDPTMDTLKNLPVGSVFQYGERNILARKKSDTSFVIFFPSGQATVHIDDARAYVGDGLIVKLVTEHAS